MARMMRRLGRGMKRAGDTVVGTIAIGLIKLLRLISPDVMANFAVWNRVADPINWKGALGACSALCRRRTSTQECCMTLQRR